MASKISQTASVVKNLEDEIKIRDNIFNRDKLRRTILSGLPCDFITFEQQTRLADGIHLETDKQVMKALGPLANKDIEPINVRATVWKVVCRVDEVQQRCLEYYEEERKDYEKKIKAFEKKYKDYANP